MPEKRAFNTLSNMFDAMDKSARKKVALPRTSSSKTSRLKKSGVVGDYAAFIRHRELRSRILNANFDKDWTSPSDYVGPANKYPESQLIRGRGSIFRTRAVRKGRGRGRGNRGSRVRGRGKGSTDVRGRGSARDTRARLGRGRARGSLRGQGQRGRGRSEILTKEQLDKELYEYMGPEAMREAIKRELDVELHSYFSKAEP